MSIEIDKGIPIPIPEAKQGRPSKYPFGSMEVGDSFFAPSTSIGQTVSKMGKFLGRKFICRTVEGGSRVWRVE